MIYINLAKIIILLSLFCVGAAAEEDQHYQPGQNVDSGPNESATASSTASVSEVAKALFDQAYMLNWGQETCTEEILEQKKFLYQKAIEECPSYIAAWNNLGDVYENLGMFQEAIAAYSQAIELYPEGPMPYFGLGDVYYRSGLYSDAIAAYEEGMALADKLLADYIGVVDILELNVSVTEERLMVARECFAAQSGEDVVSASTIVAALDLEDSEGEEITVRGPTGMKIDVPQLPLNASILPFAFNSADLSKQAEAQLDELAIAFKDQKLRNAWFTIYGHTDERGTDEYNHDLSMRRVSAVVKHLRDRGAYVDNVQIVAMGESNPIIRNASTEVAHAVNRRVEIRRMDEYDRSESTSERISLLFGIFRVDEQGKYHEIFSDATLFSNDLYQIYVKSETPCHLYIYQVEDTGKGFWLFPCELSELEFVRHSGSGEASIPALPEMPNDKNQAFANPLEANCDYWFPSRDQCFQLDDKYTGNETIYIVASPESAPDLEFYQSYTAAGHGGKPSWPDKPLPPPKVSPKPPDVSPTPSEQHQTEPASEQVVARILMRGQFQWQVVLEEPVISPTEEKEQTQTPTPEPPPVIPSPPSPTPPSLIPPLNPIIGEGYTGNYIAITFTHTEEPRALKLHNQN